MAHPKRRLPDNAPGDFYVDDSCIDCDTCRWLAPETFHAVAGQSAVRIQPDGPEARRQALLALTACPTASIGTETPAPEMAEIRRAFPLLLADTVYYCGYHSSHSFGAASYLIVRPEGNVLVDSPRRSETLAESIAALGGVRTLFLTHGDDVADHQYWHDRFQCERILHAGDVTHGTRGVERILVGDANIELASDLLLIPVPGHTEGSVVLWYQNRFLFTGDHLAYSERRGHLYAFQDACWYSWPECIRSMEKLAGYPTEWVLPGHGRRWQGNQDAWIQQMDACIRWMKAR